MDREAIRAGLHAFNLKHMIASEHRPVEFVLRDELNEVCGGILGYTRWHWLFIDTLWIDDRYRGLGHGKALLDQADFKPSVFISRVDTGNSVTYQTTQRDHGRFTW
jgi:GNAT superfamily N-acetyltransferase